MQYLVIRISRFLTTKENLVLFYRDGANAFQPANSIIQEFANNTPKAATVLDQERFMTI